MPRLGPPQVSIVGRQRRKIKPLEAGAQVPARRRCARGRARSTFVLSGPRRRGDSSPVTRVAEEIAGARSLLRGPTGALAAVWLARRPADLRRD